MTRQLALTVQQPLLAIVQLPAGSGVPWWSAASCFLSFTRTTAEDSLVCEEVRVPEGVAAHKGFRALRVDGRLPFHLTGVLASLANPLAEADVPIFAISTGDTDYVLVPETMLARAVAALREAGHSVRE
jgi:hypothetical protein